MSLTDVVVVLAAGLVAFAVAALVRRHAVSLNLLALPNERSSHEAPTPTGGGLGIVAGGTIGGVYTALHDRPEILVVVALSLLVAALGFFDDRRPLPVALRLPAQLLLTGLMVAIVPVTDDAGTVLGLDLPWVVVVGGLTLVAVYWLNIFNFMDGIDGLAGAEAAFMLLAAAGLAVEAAAGAPHVWWFVAVAAAALGFLVLNWPPAKIFMGDAGSTYLGLMIAYAALVTIANGWLSIWQWLLLGALFLADATVTLVRRAIRREPILRAHRLHAYQHLSRRWGGHRRVTTLYGAVNVVLLLPLAFWAGLYPATAPIAVASAYAVVVAGVVWAGAGAPEAQASASRTSS